jgi:hypothetical protein
VLLSTAPGALLITGDLTDGKTQLGRGQQLEEEWQVTTSDNKHSEPMVITGISELVLALLHSHLVHLLDGISPGVGECHSQTFPPISLKP